MRWATCLTDARRKLLQNLEHVSSRIPSTMEIRRILRYATHAGRITKGVPIFITRSPDGQLYKPSITNDDAELRLQGQDVLVASPRARYFRFPPGILRP